MMAAFSCDTIITPQHVDDVQAKYVKKWLHKTIKIPTVKSSLNFSENKQLLVPG